MQYDVTDDLMVFASYNSGFKGGGFQGAISNAALFAFSIDPETSESYEAGFRWSLPDNRGYFNLTAFNTEYQDLQVSVSIPSPDGLSAPFFTGNAGDARVAGVEVETFLRLTDRFDLRGSFAWTPEANYGEYRAGPCYLGQVPDGDQPGSCNLTDLRLIYTPEVGGSMTATYTQPIGSSLELIASLTGIYQSETRRDFTADPLAVQDDYFKLDARIALGSIDGRWQIAAIGRNLTDEVTVGLHSAGGLSVNVFSDARLITVDQPMTVSLQASLRF